MQVIQRFKSGPETVTIRSDVADTAAAAAEGSPDDTIELMFPPTVTPTSVVSLGERRMEDTPDASAIDLMFDPPRPMSIPQQGVGTSIRTEKGRGDAPMLVPLEE